MRDKLLPFSVLALAAAIAYSSMVPAHAQETKTAECAVIAVATAKGFEKKWEEQINTWLQAGKTEFIPVGGTVCAY